VGLFPQSFTTPNVPESTPTFAPIEIHEPEPELHSPTALQTLREEPENGFVGSPNPDHLSNPSPRTTDGEVMHATMTDVQKAIEQLGRHDGDGSRSFSFASSRGEGDDWTDRESVTDTDGETDGWHLNTRQRLAEKSRIVNEESAGPSTPMRISAPPIEVELSDESEAEDDEPTSQWYTESPSHRHHPHIPEEEEDDAQSSIKAKSSNLLVDPEPGTPVTASDTYVVPSPGADADDLPTATLSGKSFVKDQGEGPRAASSEPTATPALEPEPEVKHEQRVHAEQIPLPKSPSPANGTSPSPHPSTPPPVTSTWVPSVALTNGTPERTRTPIFQRSGTPSSSVVTTIGIQQALGTPTKPQSLLQPQGGETPPLEKPALSPLSPSKPPEEWEVEEVVDWLKAKGIDQATCDKFIGTCIISRAQVFTSDALLCRTRHYWRRSPGVGPRPAQDRNRHHRFRQTEAYCQRYFRVENATTSPSTGANFSFQQLVLPLKKCQFGSGVFAQ